jgi:tetratricopeptide (TPR) repeat protein
MGGRLRHRAAALILLLAALSLPAIAAGAGSGARPRPSAGGGNAADGSSSVDYRAAWPDLIDGRRWEEARALCEPWLELQNPVALAEAHKCLAGVELGLARVRAPEKEGVDPRTVVPRYQGPGVDRALEHVNAAMALSPNDLSIHIGRLVLLKRANRMDELAPALQESLSTYTGLDALDYWLIVPGEMFESQAYETALALYRVLEKKYPGSYRVLENVGVTLTQLARDTEALPYLEKAVELAPGDPLDNWNLAGAYERMTEPDIAEVFYRKAIDVQGEPETQRKWRCIFAEFLETVRHDRLTACEMQIAFCPDEKRTACGPPAPPAPAPSCKPEDAPDEGPPQF